MFGLAHPWQSSVDDVVLPDTLLRTQSEEEDRAWPRSPAVLLFWQESEAVRGRMLDLALVADQLPTETLLRCVDAVVDVLGRCLA